MREEQITVDYEDLEKADERDREAWNLPGRPLVPVGPHSSEEPIPESPESVDDDEDEAS